MPYDVAFQTKPEIALQQMREMLAAGVPPATALADPAYGNDGQIPPRDHRAWPAVCGGGVLQHAGLAARRSTTRTDISVGS